MIQEDRKKLEKELIRLKLEQITIITRYALSHKGINADLSKMIFDIFSDPSEKRVEIIEAAKDAFHSIILAGKAPSEDLDAYVEYLCGRIFDVMNSSFVIDSIKRLLLENILIGYPINLAHRHAFSKILQIAAEADGFPFAFAAKEALSEIFSAGIMEEQQIKDRRLFMDPKFKGHEQSIQTLIRILAPEMIEEMELEVFPNAITDKIVRNVGWRGEKYDLYAFLRIDARFTGRYLEQFIKMKREGRGLIFFLNPRFKEDLFVYANESVPSLELITNANPTVGNVTFDDLEKSRIPDQYIRSVFVRGCLLEEIVEIEHDFKNGSVKISVEGGRPEIFQMAVNWCGHAYKDTTMRSYGGDGNGLYSVFEMPYRTCGIHMDGEDRNVYFNVPTLRQIYELFYLGYFRDVKISKVRFQDLPSIYWDCVPGTVM